MSQMTFSVVEYSLKRRKTRREKFLEQMEQLIPWDKLKRKIQPHYPKCGRGRHPYPLSSMFRVHCMQLFYNFSDPAMEGALYEVESMHRFTGLNIANRLSDETTILNLRRLLERHNLGQTLFSEINQHLNSEGLILREGRIIDASIISALPSTKNKSCKRDPEMHQTKKGNEWHFGMKVHIGLGMIHSQLTTAANAHDITESGILLNGEEKRVWPDAGYQGIEKLNEHKDKKSRQVGCYAPGKHRQLEKGSPLAETEFIKSLVRARVERPFRYLKRVFGYDKVRYRGLAKNTERLFLLSGFTNLLIGKKYLLA